jgi:hypothetical protein
VHVDLRRLYGLVSEPQRNDGSIHAVLKQFHRRAVAQNVWAYEFSNERGARLGSRQGVFSDDMFHGIATEPDASNCAGILGARPRHALGVKQELEKALAQDGKPTT